MASKVSSNRALFIVGSIKGKIRRLPLICARKNCIRKKKIKEAKRIKSGKIEVLGMVSHPGLYKSATAKYITAWCHPYRDPDAFLDAKKPRILLSESDFVDPSFVEVYPSRSYKWDYFYFTMGGPKMGRRKGFDLFMDILPMLCKKNLKGVIINYTRKPLHFDKKQAKTWRAMKGSFTYYHKKLSPRKVAKIMECSRFGFFPNASDCSPLLLTESLIRNTPVFVNEDILGGWKYVNEDTGIFFSREKRDGWDNSIDKISEGEFEAKDRFMSEYGFGHASKRFARWGREHLKSFKGCKRACFEGLSHILQGFLNN